MTDDSERAELAAIKAKRGYILDLHRLLAAWDPEFLSAYETLLNAASWKERHLDRLTKELIYVGVLTALRTPEQHLATHMRAALSHGATPTQLLEVIQLVLPPAGVPSAIAALETFAAVCGKRPIDDD